MKNTGNSKSDFTLITGEEMLLTEFEWEIEMKSLPKTEFLNRVSRMGGKFEKLQVEEHKICPERHLTILKPKGDDRLVFVTYTKLANGFTTGFKFWGVTNGDICILVNSRRKVADS